MEFTKNQRTRANSSRVGFVTLFGQKNAPDHVRRVLAVPMSGKPALANTLGLGVGSRARRSAGRAKKSPEPAERSCGRHERHNERLRAAQGAGQRRSEKNAAFASKR